MKYLHDYHESDEAGTSASSAHTTDVFSGLLSSGSSFSECECRCQEEVTRKQKKRWLNIFSKSSNTINSPECDDKCCRSIDYMDFPKGYKRVETAPLLQTSSKIINSYSSTGSSGTLGVGDFSLKSLSYYDKLEKNLDGDNKQSSIFTIFSIWNTTMGSSLLAMAWGVERAGLLPALVLMILMGALCLYTAHLLIKVNRYHGSITCEVPALCRILLGNWVETLAHCFSMLVLIGANIVYWILITNFLYFSVNYFMDMNTSAPIMDTVLNCPKSENASLIVMADEPSYWTLHGTVPVYVAVIVFPILSFKKCTFFTKFTSLGTLSVLYLLIFVLVKGTIWGVNISPNLIKPHAFKDTAALSGMLALSFYIHNIIITIMNSNRDEDKNGRDLSIAFVLVTLTYILVGAGFYVSFPLVKNCIEDNMLNNFEMHDVLSAVARILLLFQVVTVYPLIAFMLRKEIILLLPLNEETKTKTFLTLAINAVNVIICILFACFCPNIGTIIRYTGAVSGLVHIFALPSLLYIKSLQLRGQLTTIKALFYGFIVVLGAFNFIMQFFIKD